MLFRITYAIVVSCDRELWESVMALVAKFSSKETICHCTVVQVITVPPPLYETLIVC